MGKQMHSRTGGRSAAERRILALASNPPDIDLAITLVVENLMRGVPHPPTNLEKLAERLGVSGFDAENMPLSGELRQHGKQFRVAYSSYLSLPQRRFTIAHELGHAVFAMTGPRYPRGGEEVERICDMFAAEFLMPTNEFQSRLGHNLTADRLLELVNIFKSPLTSVAIRATQFGKNLSVFRVEDRKIVWSCGIVREGSFDKNGYYLKAAFESLTTTSQGNVTFPMSGELDPTEGRLSWIRLANGNQTLCVLQKISSPAPSKRNAFESLYKLEA